MKAIQVHQFGEPDVLVLDDAPAPVPDAGQVVIRAKAVGVNPVETYIRSGKYGPRKFPFTPGDDCAGIVEGVGAGVKAFKPGDRVFTSKTVAGAYAELVLANEKTVHLLPAAATFQQGACIGVACGTAYRGLFQRGGGIAGEKVLIHGGTGGVGTAAIQLARAAGMVVTATAGDEVGRKYAIEQGAHHATDHKITQDANRVAELTDGRGFDLIIELAAHINLASDLPALAPGGRVVIIGSRGRIEIDPRDTMGKEADIRGLVLFGATEKEHRAIYSALSAALENRTLRPVVGLELPLADAAGAHREIMEGSSHGKIVLIP